ncbi:hypothetical protein G6M50_38215 [Agrobacterium rhizogenes]|nr:hypothetical protein [Rhizobium rhizogenes]NTJ83623.1 hypothetical protein [Rhizobium rhizogenes]
MKTSRRKFFGLLGGAAVAGPTAAKNAVANLPTGLFGLSAIGPSGPAPAYQGETATLSPSTGSWHIDEVARLKRFLSGDLTDEEKEERRRSRLYSRQQALSNHWGGMQSVAGWRKLELYNRDMELVNDEIARSHSQTYLSRLLREV